MAGLTLQNVALTLPEGTEFPGTIQELFDLIAEYMAIEGGADFIGVAYGDTEPAPESRDLWWARTDGGGNAIGWYYWDGSAWSPLPITVPSGTTAARPSSPPEGTLYLDTDINVQLIFERSQWRTASGSPGDIKQVAGTVLADVLTQNPGWSHYTDGIGRVLAGAAADGSDAETDAGADEITLTEGQLAPHNHIDLEVNGSDADNGDPGNLTIMAPGNSIGLRTITNSSTGSTGDGDPIDVRQATRYLFTLQKD